MPHNTTTAITTTTSCTEDQFRCWDNSKCIYKSWECDNYTDCSDGSDEFYCYNSTATYNKTAVVNATMSCAEDQFRCWNDSSCINRSWQCDNYTDCADGSDEFNCYNSTVTYNTTSAVNTSISCTEGQFRCWDDSKCIYKSWQCDNYTDCRDGSDEFHCYNSTVTYNTTTAVNTTISCTEDQFRCWDDSKCIYKSWECDNYTDCRDGSDEFYCYNSTATYNKTAVVNATMSCAEDQFRCWNDSSCINKSWQCDNYTDCADGSDEFRCYNSTVTVNATNTVNTTITCTDDQFRCWNDSRCIYKSWQCDNYADCTDGSDEYYCYNSTSATYSPATFNSSLKVCTEDQFRCWDDSKCIYKSWQCDNYTDCRDGSDEFHCYNSTITYNTTTAVNTTISCTEDQFRCWDDSKCIYKSWECDNYTDCRDGSDEFYCYNSTATYNKTTVVNATMSCAENQFRCWNDSSCINKSWQCDNYTDCADGSDEFYCYNSTVTYNTTSAVNTSISCTEGQFRCWDDSKCIYKSWQCDNYTDCRDGSDEFHCYNSTVTYNTTTAVNTTISCTEDQFRCWDDSKCIYKSWECDNYTDCRDGSDEFYCYNSTATYNKTTVVNATMSCAEDQFRCWNDSSCINKSWQCDNYTDCADGSDEFRCYNSTVTANATNTVNITITCTDDQFRCWNDSRCIYKSWQCDNYIDCRDGSDEFHCYNSTFTYNITTAVNTTISCTDGQFRCWDGSKCIYKSWQCDNYTDCRDGSDEFYCYNSTATMSCTEDQFRCWNDSRCIYRSWQCDNYTDCADGSDEYLCDSFNITTSNPPTITSAAKRDCTMDDFSCQDKSKCIPKRWVCDLDNDCPDGSDENNC